MGEVSSAVDAIKAQVATLHDLCEDLSHRELIGLLTELTSVVWSVPALEHQVLARLTGETEPSALGAASWVNVLTTALRISSKDAKRRLNDAKNLGPRRALTGEPLPPVWEATAAAQDGPAPCEKQRARKRSFTVGPQQRDGMSRVSGWWDPETRAYWEALSAKHAAPGMNNPDNDNPCIHGEPRREPASEPASGVDGESSVAYDPSREPASGVDGEPTGESSVAGEPSGEQKRSDRRTTPQRHHDALNTLFRTALCSGKLGTRPRLGVPPARGGRPTPRQRVSPPERYLLPEDDQGP